MSGIMFRNYTSESGITKDYYRVREFFIRRGYCEYTYARWDWMTTHSYLETQNVGKIGLWEENGDIVAVATFDCQLGDAYLITLPEYEFLKEEMIGCAEQELKGQNSAQIVIADHDHDFQSLAEKMGYIATTEKEMDAIYYPQETSCEYTLPVGFTITDLKQNYDLYQYGRVLWKGFDHEINSEGDYDLLMKNGALKSLESEMLRPNVDLTLKIATVAPDGNFTSYCGMWYDQKAGYAVIEPVATDPKYRRKGLGKAAVLEGLKRVRELGAKFAVVGSSQQFYYSIGLRPYKTATKWRKKK